MGSAGTLQLKTTERGGGRHTGFGGFQAFPDCQSVPRDPELQLGPLRVLELHTLVLPKELGVWARSSSTQL